MLKCTNVACSHSLFAQTAAGPKKEILTGQNDVVLSFMLVLFILYLFQFQQ